jgi:2-dehydro-3-deoxyphosphooctonate aldolase (KDO 8-P synthase)
LFKPGTAKKEFNKMSITVKIGDLAVGLNSPLVLVAGPCVLENFDSAFEIAVFLKKLTKELNMPFIFKASYDKANRTSMHSFRGPGLGDGLRMLQRIKAELNVPILSDIHRIAEIESAAQILDIIQVPAFLCRQSDLIREISQTQKPVNIKKGQFLAPWDISNVVEKITATGNQQILITERGTLFGYNNLVVDFRSIMIMRNTGYPIIFDATHSIQLPGGAGKSSAGQREYAPLLARAAVAAGVDGIFMEVHKDPDRALCDGPNSLKLDDLESLLPQLLEIRKAISPQSELSQPA